MDCMRLLMKLAKERVAEGMFLIVEDMLKKTKLLCNISDTVLVEEALTFLEENKVRRRRRGKKKMRERRKGGEEEGEEDEEKEGSEASPVRPPGDHPAGSGRVLGVRGRVHAEESPQDRPPVPPAGG